MRVERLHPDQWERLRDVRLRSVLAEPALYGWAWERESGFTEQHWRMRLGGAAWWVAGVPGGADDVGLVSSIHEPGASEDERLLVSLWVESGARRRGAGRALVEAAAEDAHGAGASSLSIWVPSEGEAGLALTVLGFSPTGESVAAPRAPGGEESRWSRALS